MQQIILMILVILVICGSLLAAAEEHAFLERITVTASRSELTSKEAPSSVTVITQEDILQKGSDNILDAIRGTPGVSIQGVGTAGRKAISLRGMQSKHTLMLVDGKRISSTNDSFGPNTDYQYDWIPVEQIERIEVVRGPMSVLYGSDALGGVINIITRKPQQEWTGSAKFAGHITDNDIGDGDGHTMEAGLSGSLNAKLQVGLDVQKSRRSAVNSRLTPEISTLEGREQQQLSFDADWQPVTDNNIKLVYLIGQEDRWYDTMTRSGTPYQSRYDLDRQHTSLSWEGQLKDIDATLRAYQTVVEVKNIATNSITPTAPQKVQDRVAEATTDFAFGENQFITVGAEFHKEVFEHPALTGSRDDAKIWSVYLQDEIEFSDRTRLTLGVRHDDHDRFGSETSPRASIVFNANDKLTLKASYGHGFRAPTIKQVSPGYSFAAGPFIIISNPDLKPESSDAIEMGASFSGDDFNLEFAIFNNEVKDLIDTRYNRSIGFIQEWIYDNIDESILRGAEISSSVSIYTLGFNASYQYLDARDGDKERLERQPRHTLSVGIDWETHGWNLSLWAEHLADQVTVPPGASSMTDLPDYTLWNASFRKSINKQLELAIGIENLTDVRLEDKSSDFRNEEYPRTLRIGLRSSF